MKKVSKMFFSVMAIVLVTGCASEIKLRAASENAVVVQGPWEVWDKANVIAEEACAKFGRKAKFLYNQEHQPTFYFYDCVR